MGVAARSRRDAFSEPACVRVTRRATTVAWRRTRSVSSGSYCSTSCGHGEVDVVLVDIECFGDEQDEDEQGGDQVVEADPDSGALGVVFVAPELGPVALELGVVAPDGLVGPSRAG